MTSILCWFLIILPKNWLSYWVGKIVHLRLPKPISTWTIRAFAKQYRIDLDEAEKGIGEYPSIGDFFVRKLKPNVRKIAAEGYAIHPCDAEITAGGAVEGESLLRVKGQSYFMKDFLIDPELTEKFKKGSYYVYYLCPTDYHRVHSPVDARIKRTIHLPGKLWPVNDWSVSRIEDLFCVNERVIVEMETEKGPVVLVMVGATNVGQMTMSFDSKVRTNQFQGNHPVERTYQSLSIRKGEELGIFHMGSTVVMLYPPGVHPLSNSFGVTRMGDRFID